MDFTQECKPEAIASNYWHSHNALIRLTSLSCRAFSYAESLVSTYIFNAFQLNTSKYILLQLTLNGKS